MNEPTMQHTQLWSLEIAGLRGFDSHGAHMAIAPITLCTGAQASGKSTVVLALEACARAARRDRAWFAAIDAQSSLLHVPAPGRAGAPAHEIAIEANVHTSAGEHGHWTCTVMKDNTGGFAIREEPAHTDASAGGGLDAQRTRAALATIRTSMVEPDAPGEHARACAALGRIRAHARAFADLNEALGEWEPRCTGLWPSGDGLGDPIINGYARPRSFALDRHIRALCALLDPAPCACIAIDSPEIGMHEDTEAAFITRVEEMRHGATTLLATHSRTMTDATDLGTEPHPCTRTGAQGQIVIEYVTRPANGSGPTP